MLMVKGKLLRKLLAEKLTEDEVRLVPSSFDIVGDIAVFQNFPEELKKKEKLIAGALMSLNKNIKTVAKKIGTVSGKYRLPKVKIVAGKKTKETVHKENGVLLKLNVEKCYFSPRLSAERLRIARLVKKGERVLVMFSGIAAYSLVISKNSNAGEILGIELNPVAHRFALENLRINKASNIRVYFGDVKKILPKLNKKFDRIVMPLPRNAEGFLDLALKHANKKAVLHFYDFEQADELNKAAEKIRAHCKRCKILRIVKCGQYAPGRYRICVDFKVL